MLKRRLYGETKSSLQRLTTGLPKKIHIIWIGDESLRPEEQISTWKRMNPDFTVQVWGNAELKNRPWRNARHMMEMWNVELCGVADLMRYEILFEEGGIYVDADSICLRPLDSLILEHDPFACWENEVVQPGLISNGFLGSSPKNPLFGELIDEIFACKTVTDMPAWKSTGPMRVTNTVRRLAYSNLTLFPSHFFLPRHWTGVTYSGPGRIYSKHDWDSTNHKQKELGEKRPPTPNIDVKVKTIKPA